MAEKPDQKKKKSKKSKKKEKQNDTEATQEEEEDETPSTNNHNNGDEREKVEGGTPAPKSGTSTEVAAGRNSKVENLNLNSGNKTVDNVQMVKEVKIEAKKPAEGVADGAEEIPAQEKKVSESEAAAGGEKSGSATGGKKKKKKGHKANFGNIDNGEPAGQNCGPVAGSESQHHADGYGPAPGAGPHPYPINLSPPIHPHGPHPHPHPHVSDYPPSNYAPPPPVYAVSYNAAYPTTSYGASYYAAPPPYSNAFVHYGTDVETPVPSDWSSASVQPSDTFELFSDENPNACAVM
ncbi:hypothetical protein Ancab_000719 [Ancistrocladus abbreviatus]